MITQTVLALVLFGQAMAMWTAPLLALQRSMLSPPDDQQRTY
jgi:hypothetical protein